MPDILTQIATTERQIQSVKFRLKDLRSRRWETNGRNEKKDFDPEIQKLEIELVDRRKSLAKLIVEQYRVKL